MGGIKFRLFYQGEIIGYEQHRKGGPDDPQQIFIEHAPVVNEETMKKFNLNPNKEYHCGYSENLLKHDGKVQIF